MNEPIFTSQFLESHRAQRVDDDTIADYIAGKSPAFRQQLNKIREKSGNDPRAVTGFLNWRVYGDPKGVQQEEKGFFGRVADDFKERSAQLGKTWEQYQQGERSAPEVALRTLGRGAGAVGDVVTEGMRSAINYTPEAVKAPVRAVAGAVANSGPGQAVLGGVKKVSEGYQGLKEAHPRIVEPLEDIGNIASLYPGAKAAKTGTDVAKAGVKAGAELAEAGLESSLKRQVTREALEIVKPKLSRVEKEAALKQGRGSVMGLLRTETVAPSRHDLEVAEAAQGLVKKGKSPYKNIGSLKAEIAKEAEASVAGIKKADAIFNEKELRGALNAAKEESRVIFGSDKSLEAAYDAVVDEFVKQVKGKKKLSTVLQARKDFDDIVESKFKNLFANGPGDNVRKNAIFDVRRAANDFVADRLPDGAPFKQSLRRQTLLYRAVDNIAKKAAGRLDTNVVTRALDAIKRNPAVSRVGALGLGVGIGTGILAAIFASPATLAALSAGAAIKIGKTVVTSKMLKKGLLKIMKSIPKADRKALQALSDSL